MVNNDNEIKTPQTHPEHHTVGRFVSERAIGRTYHELHAGDPRLKSIAQPPLPPTVCPPCRRPKPDCRCPRPEVLP